jgi:uncharacterized protein
MAIYIVEMVIVLVLFLLPSFLPVSGAEAMSPIFILSYLLVALPQVFLLWYYLANRDPGLLDGFGLKRIRGLDVVRGVLCAPVLFLIYFALAFGVTFLLPREAGDWLAEGYRWKLSNPAAIPMILVFCLATGYREEMLFRSYLFVRCTQTGLPVAVTVIVNSLLFASLHLYEGPLGFVFAFSISLFLAFVFIRFRNIHIIGIGHGLFNFAALLISMLFPGT